MNRQKRQCCGCGVCAAACPHGAIAMKADAEGFAYPKTDRKMCTGCGRCEAVCPMDPPPAPKRERRYLGAQARAEEARFGSASGGVFPVLAGEILRRGGAVYGAAMEAGGTVRHRKVQTAEGLSALRGTKYVQSELHACCPEIRQLVKEGTPVLFTGTPCQCRAVRQYIGEAENLFLADLVCYGVPSPGLWEKYRRELEKQYQGAFESLSFRDKRGRDNGHTIAARIGGKEYTWPMSEDAYCRVYFQNYSLRPSCFDCPFCTTERESDLTMGDFWGIERVRPEWEDGMGTSLVILHSPKGEALWESVQEVFRWFSCRREDLLQPRLCTPSEWPGKRGRLYLRLSRLVPLGMAERIVRKRLF